MPWSVEGDIAVGASVTSRTSALRDIGGDGGGGGVGVGGGDAIEEHDTHRALTRWEQPTRRLPAAWSLTRTPVQN